MTTADPIIFRPLKSLTLTDPQQTSLLRLAQAGISVYSPHTAVDASPGGMGDWLCDVVTGCYPAAAAGGAGASASTTGETTNMAPQPEDDKGDIPIYPNPSQIGTKQPAPLAHTRSTIHPHPGEPSPPQDETPGMGRLVTLHTPQPLRTILEHIATGTGLPSPSGIPVAVPQVVTTTDTITGTKPAGTDVGRIPIRTIGVCPGSGAGVLLKTPDGRMPDLLFTGEMSHHETLAAVERGSVVVAVRHSNTERGFLHAVMREALEGVVKKEWSSRVQDQGSAQDEEILKDDQVLVQVSEMDRDPFGLLLRGV